ncbi:LysR family transcriptional regulator [Crassaminicella thermophila]|uniref:LysR family transcriptional regulator n=1 Tax=Crassaminicella thermophila TaxID=2599308 RepID=A0A5C0SF61_CRATE|nr:LysR family transcriptional regulator [Crassaminicella thermophila]QEK12981.1 LysR family transcriptional regulator [Crassaminicella thermophila]
MNIEYCKAFYITVKVNSISKAAKILHLSQPALSMQIQSLEKELQVSLLKRSNKGVELTEAGEILFDYADTLLSLHENIERDIANHKSNNIQLLIGSCKTVGEYALPCSLYTYKQDHKNINIHFEITNTSGVVENLINRNINIGIIQGDMHYKNIKSEKITSDQLLLVTSLPNIKDTISLEELTKLPIILREEGSGTRAIIKKFLESHGMKLDDLNIIYELNSMEAIKSSVVAGKGISFIPEMTIRKELKTGILNRIHINNFEIVSDYYVVYRNKLDTHEKEFIKFIKSNKRGFC